MRPVLTLTMNPALDVTVTIPKLQPWRKLRATDERQYPGGGGINVARMLKRMQVPVRAFYPYGGCSGSRLKRLLRNEGVEQISLPIRGETRSNILVFDQHDHQFYRVIRKGPALSPAEWRQCRKALGQALHESCLLVVSGSLPQGAPPDLYAQVANLAREAGIPMLLDSADRSVEQVLAEGFWTLRLNHREFQAFIGKQAGSKETLAEMAMDFVAKHPIENLIVTLGKGALLMSRDQYIEVRSPDIEPMSASGGGDSFVAGFVAQWIGQRPPDEALRYAAAAAAAALIRPLGELAKIEDIDRLYPQTCLVNRELSTSPA